MAVADTDAPLQTAPAAGVGVNVPAVGCALTVTVADALGVVQVPLVKTALK